MSQNLQRKSSRLVVLATVGALLAALLVSVGVQPAAAAPVVVASDLTSGAPLNLVSFTDDPRIPFTSRLTASACSSAAYRQQFRSL